MIFFSRVSSGPVLTESDAKNVDKITVKNNTCFGKLFPQNRGEITPVSKFVGLVERLVSKWVLECLDHFNIALKMILGKGLLKPSIIFYSDCPPSSKRIILKQNQRRHCTSDY